MSREIHLDGGEITVLKALGLSGTPMQGKNLLEQVRELEPAELIETIDGLMTMGYVLASKVNVRTLEDIERTLFRVNPSYSRDLRESVYPGRGREPQQRRRRRS